MEREPNAASVALGAGDRVLLIERARPPYANLWTLPGGRREPDETPEQCAVREVREELGLAVRSPVPVLTSSVREIVGQNWQLAVFATTSFEGHSVPSDEIAACQWVTRDEARKLRTTPGLDTTLELVFRVLQQMQTQQ